MDVTKFETVLVKKEDRIAWVILNRPEKRNAMSPQLDREMDEILTELETDDDTGVVVITGEGEAFSAGRDLKEFMRETQDDPKKAKQAQDAGNWRWTKLYMYDKPTIAMVNGFCMGGAMTAMLACDFAIAAEDTMFGLPEINFGGIPAGIVAKVITEAVSYRDAIYLAVTGKPITGTEAARMRLVNDAVPKEELRERTVELANELMKIDPEAMRGTKHAIRSVRDMDFQSSSDYLMAKVREVDVRSGFKRQKGMAKFLDEKSYRPGQSAFGGTDAE